MPVVTVLTQCEASSGFIKLIPSTDLKWLLLQPYFGTALSFGRCAIIDAIKRMAEAHTLLTDPWNIKAEF